MVGRTAAAVRGEVDETDRLRSGSAVWPSDTRYRDGQIRFRPRDRTFRHGDGNLPADSAVRHDQNAINTKQLSLRNIRIGNETPFQNGR